MTSKSKKKIRTRKGTDKRYVHSSERSPYWDDFALRRQESNDLEELPQANPDVLREDEAMFADCQPSTPQLLMGEAVAHLQGRQLQVYMLTMRDGKSLAETAEILDIEKGTAQKYKERAIKFIAAYCKQAIDRGRV
jgi:DNA-directed RNA polymerase specialized sigma24 family protein